MWYKNDDKRKQPQYFVTHWFCKIDLEINLGNINLGNKWDHDIFFYNTTERLRNYIDRFVRKKIKN